jgi:cbb3-type cytochrome oxidase subunit 3
VVLAFSLTAAFFAVCLAVVTWIFRTGYRLKS